MAVLQLRAFGTMAPSANAKAMPDTAGVLVQNLNLRFGDFRPMPAPATIGNLAAGGTLYKFETGGGGFITRPGTVNFVRGQIPTDTTERTYYTGDGAPKVMDNTGAVRQLGVPSPAAAPVVAVNTTDEYSTDDSAADQAKKQAEMVAAIKSHYTWPYAGLSSSDLGARFEQTSVDAPWSTSLQIPGSMQGGAFYPDNPNHFNLMDDRMGFHVRPNGAGVMGLIDLDVRGQKMFFDLDGMGTDLAAIADPSDATGVKKMLSVDQIMSIKASVSDAIAPMDSAFQTDVARLIDLKNQFLAAADSGSPAAAANINAIKAFYAKAAVVSEIDAAVQQAVGVIYAAMLTYNNP